MTSSFLSVSSLGGNRTNSASVTTGAMTMKMMSSTSTTSTSGVMFMSGETLAFLPPPMLIPMACLLPVLGFPFGAHTHGQRDHGKPDVLDLGEKLPDGLERQPTIRAKENPAIGVLGELFLDGGEDDLSGRVLFVQRIDLVLVDRDRERLFLVGGFLRLIDLHDLDRFAFLNVGQHHHEDDEEHQHDVDQWSNVDVGLGAL